MSEQTIPTPRDDIPVLLVGYEQVEEYKQRMTRDFERSLQDQIEIAARFRGENARLHDDMRAIRELAAEAVEAYARGEDVRDRLTRIAAHAAGQEESS